METTREDLTPGDVDGLDQPSWWLCVAYSDDIANVGHRARVDIERGLTLGRGVDVLGPGVFDDSRVSRRHARIEPLAEAEGGGLVLRDLGSHNGTRVGGRQVSRARLVAGDVIAIGRTLLVLCRAPLRFSPRPYPGIDGCGFIHAQIAAAIDKVAQRSTTVILVGEPGSGKGHLAAEIHRRSGRPGPLVTVECGVFRGEQAFHRLLGHDERSGCFVEARGGTLFLDGIDEADADFQRCALALVDRCESSGEVRVLASSLAELTSGGPVREELRARLVRWVVRLAPLRSRREDIPALARAFVERFAGRPIDLNFRLACALLHHDWPGNVRELEATIERVVIDADERAPLRLSAGARHLLGLDPPENAVAFLSEATFSIAASGGWFRPPQGERVAIDHRPTLARLLGALAHQARSDPGEALSLHELLAAGWPDEEVIEAAGTNRVYVALTTLRKLGLRAALVRTRAGYLLDPGLDLHFVDE